MNTRHPLNESLAIVLVAILPLVALPARAAEATATLTGSIVQAADRTPLAGARLHVNDPKAGKIFSSEPTGDNGGFVLAELPPATYSLAVESNGGLYKVEAPLVLAPGTARTLNLAVIPQADTEEGVDDDDDSKWGPLENPGTAALLVAGIAVGIGLLIGEANDEGQASPVMPLN